MRLSTSSIYLSLLCFSLLSAAVPQSNRGNAGLLKRDDGASDQGHAGAPEGRRLRLRNRRSMNHAPRNGNGVGKIQKKRDCQNPLKPHSSGASSPQSSSSGGNSAPSHTASSVVHSSSTKSTTTTQPTATNNAYANTYLAVPCNNGVTNKRATGFGHNLGPADWDTTMAAQKINDAVKQYATEYNTKKKRDATPWIQFLEEAVGRTGTAGCHDLINGQCMPGNGGDYGDDKCAPIQNNKRDETSDNPDHPESFGLVTRAGPQKPIQSSNPASTMVSSSLSGLFAMGKQNLADADFVFDMIGHGDPGGVNSFIQTFEWFKKKAADVMAIINIVLGALSILIPFAMAATAAIRAAMTVEATVVADVAAEESIVDTATRSMKPMTFEGRAKPPPKSVTDKISMCTKAGSKSCGQVMDDLDPPPPYTKIADAKNALPAAEKDRKVDPDDKTSDYVKNHPDAAPLPSTFEINIKENPVTKEKTVETKVKGGGKGGGFTNAYIGASDIELGAYILGGHKTESTDAYQSDTIAAMYLGDRLKQNYKDQVTQSHLSMYDFTPGALRNWAAQVAGGVAANVNLGNFGYKDGQGIINPWPDTKKMVAFQAASMFMSSIMGADRTYKYIVFLVPWKCTNDKTAQADEHKHFWDMFPAFHDPICVDMDDTGESALLVEIKTWAKITQIPMGRAGSKCTIPNSGHLVDVVEGMNWNAQPGCKQGEDPSAENKACLRYDMIVKTVVATGWSVNYAPTDPSILLAAAGAATDLPYATLDAPFTIGHFANLIVSLKYTNADDVDLIRQNYKMMAYDSKWPDLTKGWPMRPWTDFPSWWDRKKGWEDCMNFPNDWWKTHKTYDEDHGP